MPGRYVIVNGKDTTFNGAQNTLITVVCTQMEAGWMPQGGIAYLGVWREPDGVDRFVFTQAMVKSEGEGEGE